MAAMNATSDTLNSLEVSANNCIRQTSILKENIVLPRMLMYNPEASSLVESVQSELLELEDALNQLHRLAMERHTHLSTIEVIISMYLCRISVRNGIDFVVVI